MKLNTVSWFLLAHRKSFQAIALLLATLAFFSLGTQANAQIQPPGGVPAPPAPPLPHISNWVFTKNGQPFLPANPATHFYSRGDTISGSALAIGNSPHGQPMRFRLRMEISSGPPNATILISNESSIVVAPNTNFSFGVTLPNLTLPPAPGPIPATLHCSVYLYSEEPVGPNPHPFLWDSKSLFLQWNGN